MNPPPQSASTGRSRSPVRIELHPLGTTITVPPGTSLHDILFAQGAEFPCGGHGRCKGCRIKVLAGTLPVTDEDRRLLRPEEIAGGWRLACRGRAEQDLTLELAQWEASILTDESGFAFSPQEGLGIAVDLGTTTLVAQLVDRRTGHVLAVRTGLNRQAKHGADIMSRVDFAIGGEGRSILQQLIRDQIGELIAELVHAAAVSPPEVRMVVLVGNTAMHHLFSGLDPEPLAYNPFEPTEIGLQIFPAGALGWNLRPECPVHFLPCLGGFVGSDILTGVLATRLHEQTALTALIDLGTNGEIVVGNRNRLLCASTAAGPAFEGARITMGMRAASAAISEVDILNGQLHCRVLGNVAPRGICGSGLVDAVAAGLELGWVQPNGRLTRGNTLSLLPPVQLYQSDIRELQLAKGAITAGLRVLVQKWGATLKDLSRIFLAGAFGNYIRRTSARRIGLLPFHPDKILPSGNTALLGAKMTLFQLPEQEAVYAPLLHRVEHVPLKMDPLFQDIYVEEMSFPHGN